MEGQKLDLTLGHPRSTDGVRVSRPCRLLMLGLFLVSCCAQWSVTGATSSSSSFTDDDLFYVGECSRSINSQVFVIPTRKHRTLQEIHVRNNLKGNVVVRDSASSSNVRIEVEKAGTSAKVMGNIKINKTLYDIGKDRDIYVIQLDYEEEETEVVSVVIGAVVAGAILVAVVIFIIFWYYRKRRQLQFSPVHSQGLQQGCELGEHCLEGEDLSTSAAQDEVDILPPEHPEMEAQRPNGGATVQSCPPPPPPRRGDPGYRAEGSPPLLAPGGPPVGSPRPLSRTTVVSLSIMTVISLVYAGCPVAQVKVIVVIPPSFALRSLKVFFNDAYQNRIQTSQWSTRNATQVQIFDLDSVPPTHNAPCLPKQQCRQADIQNLAGCDARTRQCVCQRGYYMSNGLCTDVNECKSGAHHCPSTATCQNKIGSYQCQCGYGFYTDDNSCKACSVGCPPGHYEAKPCTNFGDRVCTPCTECTGSKYEARPCGGTNDRHCIHAAHPLLIAQEETTISYLEELKVEVSENVFPEDLHATKSLETTNYLADTTQTLDFDWPRNSGLKVNIGVAKVNLVPEYRDVSHESDNKYLLDNPNNAEDKLRFRNLLEHFCRNPIPDYYSVSLEIARDRTTAAKQVVCDSSDPSKPRCPPGYNNGDTYLNRTLNDECKKMGTFPKKLELNPNSLLCTENTDLLTQVFNQTYTQERPIRFKTRRCNNAQRRCDQCRSQTSCQKTDLFEEKCCEIDCYTLPDCKMSTAEQCTGADVECAMGDVYRYTIHPIFGNLQQEFKCHVHHHSPKVLYELFYTLLIPSRNFKTEPVYRTVYAHDLNYQSHGEFTTEYITVEHNTGLLLQDEFILIGKADQKSEKKTNYTVYPMRHPSEFKNKRVVVHEISNNVFVAKTQFDRPFAYSTSKWVKNGCNKDVSKLKDLQEHHTPEGQPVQVTISPTSNPDVPFSYMLKSVEADSPFIRFTVPGNTSILPYYFRDTGPTLITNSSLQSVLELSSGGRIWNIHIRGRMTAVPAYLGITINNREDLEELFRHDLLILDRPDFNVTFKVPNWGQQPDKTFDVHLEDAKKSYDIYLTHLLFEQNTVQQKPEALTVAPPIRTSFAVLGVVSAITAGLLLILVAFFVYTESGKSKVAYAQAQQQMVKHVYSQSSRAGSPGRETSCLSTSHLNQGQLAFIGMYIVLRLVYSLIFTFTVFFAILFMLIDSDLEQFTSLGKYQREKLNHSLTVSANIHNYSQEELERQATLVTSMQGACSNYIEELFVSTRGQMENLTANQRFLDMYGDQSSISYLMQQRFREHVADYRSKVTNFSGEYEKLFTQATQSFLIQYRRYLKEVFRNDWVSFPQKLYNISTYGASRPKVLRENAQLGGVEVDFAAFLQVEEVEEVQLWAVQYWERYWRQMPNLPNLPSVKVNPNALSCGVDLRRNISHHKPLQQLDSAHFASKSPEKPTFVLPKLEVSADAEEYTLSLDEKKDKVALFSMDELSNSVNIDILRLVFLILDGVILLYRLSHTYLSVCRLCRGFEESINYPGFLSKGMHPVLTNGKSGYHGPAHQQTRPIAGEDRTTEHTSLTETRSVHFADTTIPDYNAPLARSTPRLAARHQGPQASGSNGMASKPLQNSKTCCAEECQILGPIVSKILQSSAVPKFLFGIVFLVLFYVFMKLSVQVLDAMVLVDWDVYGIFLQGVDVYANQTNLYLNQQADHLNQAAMKAYRNQMNSELLHLQSMLEYFNSEQTRLVNNYLNESCAVKEQKLLNWTCNVGLTIPKLRIPLLPCNFIPVQPQLYSGLRVSEYVHQLAKDFSPYLQAARHFIATCGYAILSVVLCVLLIHVIGAVVFHILKVKRKFPVRTIYITSLPPSSGGSSRGESRHPQTEESDFESEDMDGGFRNYPTPTHLRMSSSPNKPNTLLTDFKYSETKV